MNKPVQRVLHCPCGRAKIAARGLCAVCYALKRQDRQHFGGRREAVLDRDGRRCRVCGKPGRRKRSIALHHRVPGVSEDDLMITLCLGCHAKVTRTLVMNRCWPPLLIELWREQHPSGHEQAQLDFRLRAVPPSQVPLFPAREQAMELPARGKLGKGKRPFPAFPPPLEALR